MEDAGEEDEWGRRVAQERVEGQGGHGRWVQTGRERDEGRDGGASEHPTTTTHPGHHLTSDSDWLAWVTPKG